MTSSRNPSVRLRPGTALLLLFYIVPTLALSQTNTVDPVIYGGRPVEAKPELPSRPEYEPPVSVPAESALEGSPLITQGQAAIAAANEPAASVPASINAAMSLWSPLHLVEYFKRPTFLWDKDYNALNMLEQVDFPLSLAQEKFLLETRSRDEFQYRLGVLREETKARKTMADNPIASILAVLSTYFLLLFIPLVGLRSIRKRRKISSGTATPLANVR